MTADGGRTSLSIEEVQDPDYKRFDTIGLNYRMPQIVAAVAYSQLKNSKYIVSKRKASANYFRKAIKNCKWLVEQKIPQNCEHSHYTFAVKFLPKKLDYKYSWKNIYNKYKNMGGDGFYGACAPIYKEPSIIKYLKKHKSTYTHKIKLPNVEMIQKQIMQFKTNYRDLSDAKKKADILKKLILSLESK